MEIVSNSTAATFGNSPQKTGEPLDHAKLYSGKALEFDGVLVVSKTWTVDITADTDKEFKIGSDYSANNEFNGNIAQVGWFSAALTQEQIQSIKEKSYSELTTSEKTNLVSWWGLDVNANDEHGSNNGTLS